MTAVARQTQLSPDTFGQCEKHSKKEEALAKLRDGVKFDDVAREFSEDKQRQGTVVHPRLLSCTL
jgi:hypothetical protein